MLKISALRFSSLPDESALKKAAAEAAHISAAAINSVSVLRRSVDARRGTAAFVYTLAVSCKNEEKILVRKRDNISPYVKKEYSFPYSGISTEERPLIVGMGPAGLFCALALCYAGVKPILIERGKDVDKRTADVETFWNGGELDTGSNVQFGEGGAGTFSDGKLVTGINDTRVSWVLEQLVSFGAPEDILWLSAPHVGTDKLKISVTALREKLISLGCDVRFESTLTGIETENGAVSAAVIRHHETEYILPVRKIVLAPGNGARNTFEMLSGLGISLAPKSFSIGVRIEHLQREIDLAQYGSVGVFPPSSYKLAEHLPSGRSVYSFCVCPGGQVVAAASEKGRTVTNGMSYYARDGENINGALLVGVSPEDFPEGPLGGIELQRKIEKACFDASGSYKAPAQLLGDFMAKVPSKSIGRVKPSYRPGVTLTNLWDILPGFICESLYDALPSFARKIRGFDDKDAVLTAVESRSSCPVRIVRNAGFQSEGLAGLFPCGEGAGYAGGITSSAVDGIKCAEAVCRALLNS